MKPYYITTLFLILLFCSCHRRPAASLHPALQQAQSLMQSHSDSALVLLRYFSSKSFSDSSDMAAYALLRTKAEDKNYIDHTNDSLINLAVSYYDRHGSDLQKVEAHYYLGRTFQDRGDDVHAAEQFIKASSFAQKLDNKEKLYQIQTNLAFLFWNNNIYDQADSLYRQVVVWNKNQKNYEGLAIAYGKLGAIAMQNKNPDYKRAERYLNTAYLLLGKIRNNHIKNDILSSLIYLYVNINRPLNVLKLSKESERLSKDNYHIYETYLAKGCAYKQIDCNDSAKKYLSLSLSSVYNTTKAEAYHQLKVIAEKEGDKSSALSYANAYNMYRDSIDNNRQSDQVIAVFKNLINKQVELKHKAAEKRFKQILYIAAFVIIILLYLFYSKRRYINEVLSLLHATISDNKSSIAALKDTIKQKDLTIQELSTSEWKHAKLSKCESGIIQNSLPFETLRQHFEKYPICDIIIRAIHNNKELMSSQELLNDTEWKMFEEAVADMLPYLVKELHNERYSLNEKNFRFCCLLCLGFNFTEIAYIFGCTPQAINKRKNKVFKKMEVDSLEELEDLIKKLREQSLS